MPKLVIFHDTLGVYGGSQTLMLRMCQWLRKHGEDVLFLCDRDDNTEIVGKILDCGGQIIKVGGDKVRNITNALRPYLGRDILMINFMWDYYIQTEIAKRALGARFHNLFYSIAPEAFDKDPKRRNAFIRKIVLSVYSGMFRRMKENHAVVVMDEICLERSEPWWKAGMQQQPPILRLPISFPDDIDKEALITNGYASNMILTASRADFPMKGYLLGLIDDFCALKQIFPDAVLRIVAAGQDENRLKEKIGNVPENIRKDITWIAWLPYEDVLSEIAKCRVFIGMGSTLLDAAKLCKVCIPVRAFTEANQAASFFEEEPRYLAAPDDCRTSACPLLKESIGWGFEEYRKRCLLHYDAVKRLYDEDKIMQELLAMETKEADCLLTWSEILYCKLKMLRNRWKNRNNKKLPYDYNTLSKAN